MCLVTKRIQRVVSSKTVIVLLLWIIPKKKNFNDNGKDSLLLRHTIHKHFRVSFDHEDKHHAPFLKTICDPSVQNQSHVAENIN